MLDSTKGSFSLFFETCFMCEYLINFGGRSMDCKKNVYLIFRWMFYRHWLDLFDLWFHLTQIFRVLFQMTSLLVSIGYWSHPPSSLCCVVSVTSHMVVFDLWNWIYISYWVLSLMSMKWFLFSCKFGLKSNV